MKLRVGSLVKLKWMDDSPDCPLATDDGATSTGYFNQNEVGIVLAFEKHPVVLDHRAKILTAKGIIGWVYADELVRITL